LAFLLARSPAAHADRRLNLGLLGWVYFHFVHERKGSFGKAVLTAWILGEPVHQLWWFMTYWIMKTREDAILAVTSDWVLPGTGTFFGIPYWWLSGLLFVPIGLLAGEAARRAMLSGRQQTKPKPAGD
jgi:hypothetical protein